MARRQTAEPAGRLVVPCALEVVFELVEQDVGVSGGDDELVAWHIAAVDARSRRNLGSTEQADLFNLGLGPDQHGDRPDFIRLAAKCLAVAVGVPRAQVPTLGRAARYREREEEGYGKSTQTAMRRPLEWGAG